MTSVRKLVLVPKDEWEKMQKMLPKVAGENHKEVSVTAPMNQRGSGQEKEVEIAAPPEPLPAAPPPPPTPTGEKGEGKGGETHAYVERADTGKDQTPDEVKRDAGVWRPPGVPVSRRKGWIFL